MSLDVHLTALRRTSVFDWNITHNLGSMAAEAGIYRHLWRPEEVSATHAADLIGPLEEGLKRLEGDPERFKAFNPKNGWGDYGRLVCFVRHYLKACQDNPDALISVCR